MKKKDNTSGKVLTWDDVELLIVGAGTMGASLAQTYAQSGFTVGLIDVRSDILHEALDRIGSELGAAQKAGIFSESQTHEIGSRILGTISYEEACRGKKLKLVIESATEDIEIKKRIFKTLDELCAPDVVLASNTSSLDINILARETNRPEKVVWMHFFYLPHKNRAAEYAGSETASPQSIERAAEYMKLAGKIAIPIHSSRKGGAADVIFVSLLLEAARMIDEGFDIPSIEAAGKKAFQMPMGFLRLMDQTGIPLGIQTMESFSDSSDPDDPLYRVYHNFFSPPESYKRLIEEYQKAEDKSSVKWVSEEDAQKEPEDLMLIDALKNRFLAVGFATAAEVVEAGLIKMEDVDRLCETAFLWNEGPFALMNKVGLQEAMRLVVEKMQLSHRREINFPIPQLLISQAHKNQPWPLEQGSVITTFENEERVARIMISNPRTANALDDRVFEGLKVSFNKANTDERIKVIIFDSAPIKTFIAGTDFSYFIRAVREGRVQGLKQDTSRWQEMIFHELTGGGKPKIAIVDGAAYGGGVEVALAFALDAGSVVVATDRTSYAFPETRSGIYPGLRGTLTLPQLIHQATGDKELTLALSRYCILAGGAVSSPRLLKHLGLVDVIVPARQRDEAASVLATAIIDNGGQPLSEQQLETLNIEELPAQLTPDEEEELRKVREVFSAQDALSRLTAPREGRAENSFSPEAKTFVERAARKIAENSSHAVGVAGRLIDKGFDEYLEGRSLDERAEREMNESLVKAFQHPDALEGLLAFVEKRTPRFSRKNRD